MSFFLDLVQYESDIIVTADTAFPKTPNILGFCLFRFQDPFSAKGFFLSNHLFFSVGKGMVHFDRTDLLLFHLD